MDILGSESAVRRAFLAEVGASPAVVLFPNPSGMAKFGGRRITYGLAPGASDTIGWLTAPDGRALFLAVEFKKSPDSPFRAGQREFVQRVCDSGGIGLVVHSGNWERSAADLLRMARDV